jgi:hypothetical protein
VWIVTGIVMGALVYAGMVTMLVAGFTPVTPFVIMPPVLIALIAGNSLLGGGRTSGRSPRGRPAGPAPAPPPSPGANGRRRVEPVPTATEEPGEPR